MVKPILNFVSPMPPRPNGIADYALVIANELAKTMHIRMVTDDCFARVPASTSVYDPEQMFRYSKVTDYFSYQIGNNPDHGFVLEALRRFPGVVTLHDLNLLYLYEVTGQTAAVISDVMVRSSPKIGRIWSLHQREGLGGNKSKHLLFDMLPEILTISKRVIVHSQFAKDKIALRYGKVAADKIDIIPHFAPPTDRYDREKCRAALGLGPDELLILTSGFATKAKRFDWVIEALDEVQRSGRSFQWIHAGEERASEFPLTDLINQHEQLRKVTKVTGYLTEPELDTYIGAADIVLNLRFPSVGESSGTLARSYAAGACCVVSGTAAYADIGYDRVVHIPVLFAVRALVYAIGTLIDYPKVRRTIGDRARNWAKQELSLDRVAQRYSEVFDAAAKVQPKVEIRGLNPKSPFVSIVELEGPVDEDTRRLEKALLTFDQNGRLLLRYSDDQALTKLLRAAPLRMTLAKHGLTAQDILVRRVNKASEEPDATGKELEITITIGT